MEVGQALNLCVTVAANYFNVLLETTSILLAVYCNPLSTPTNGAKSTGNVMFETEVKFACNEGYTLIGSPSITCLSNGSWSSNPSVCEG